MSGGTLTPEYVSAMSRSYAGQSDTISIPHSDGITVIPLGFQPMGMSVRNVGGVDHLAIADYFGPSIVTIEFSRYSSDGLTGKVSWIRGVDHTVDFDEVSVRLFPGRPTFSDVSRAQTVIWLRDDTMWTSRNGERAFSVISAAQENNQSVDYTVLRRRLTGKFSLPCPQDHESTGKRDQVHTAYWCEEGGSGTLHTIETNPNQTRWFKRTYVQQSSVWCKVGNDVPLAGFTYGLAMRLNDYNWWYIHDYRSGHPSKGLHCYGRDPSVPVLPAGTIKTASGHDGLCGNGLAFLGDGSLLITRYGQSYPGSLNGIPGALIHVPAAMLK